MGEQDISQDVNAAERREFMQRLLTDLQALEEMLRRGMIESERSRIGAEQEFVLIDPSYRPAPVNLAVLETLDDPQFTTELARFNLEFNLPPLKLGGECLRRMEEQISANLSKVRAAAQKHGADVLLAGILPTLEPSDMVLENMTPLPRYEALNQTLMALRGGPYQFVIKGIDELSARQDSVLLEACSTSFQAHFQVSPKDFVQLYNVAQAVSAPVLAAATNSPILFGKRLWRETRIAVFHQSVDARDRGDARRELNPRVSFGTKWLRKSVLEIYREDVSRFRVLLVTEREDDPFELIEKGLAPTLKALQTHNSTVYRWNRPCYGITNGKPHLRIENRYLPAGPTPCDEVANAAFWFGLMAGVSQTYPDVTRVMEFDVAKGNFMAAAEHGLNAQFNWLDGSLAPAQELISERLLPLAAEGLRHLNIDAADADRYLGVIEARVRTGQSGAQWLLQSLQACRDQDTKAGMFNSITAAMHEHQQTGVPVHEWPPLRTDSQPAWDKNYKRVGQYMTTDLFTVNQDEAIDLVASLMDWERIRHVPVEDNHHKLVGLVSYRTLLRFMARNMPRGIHRAVAVREIMRADPITITPETTTLEAVRMMRANGVSCLPVVNPDHTLVGIITEHDLLNIAASMLERQLKRE